MAKQYSEEEYTEILRRAAHIQAERSKKQQSQGLSLEELKEVAASAGIDPEAVEFAVAGLAEDESSQHSRFGIPEGVRVNSLIEGHISDEEWARMVSYFREYLGGQGSNESNGEFREWYRSPLRVVVQPEGNHTRVKAIGRWPSALNGVTAAAGITTFMGGVVAVAGLLKGKPELLNMALLFPAMGGAMATYGWWSLRQKAKRVKGKFEHVIEKMRGIAQHKQDSTTQVASSSPLKKGDHRGSTTVDPAVNLPSEEEFGKTSTSSADRDRLRS